MFLITRSPEQIKTDTEHGNSDVVVHLENGEKYVATFYAYGNIVRLQKEHQISGAFLKGKYFQANNMVLIDDCSEENVQAVVEHMLEEGDFKTVFKKIANETSN